MLVYKHLKRNSQYSIILTLCLQYTHINMNTVDYWPMAREYSIWNAVVAALNFWTADLEAHTLGSTTEEVYLRPVCRRLMYSPSDADATSEDEVQYPTPDSRSTPSKHTIATSEHLEDEANEEKDFQTIPLDNEHWATEDIPERPLCIHEHSLPHGLCPYPCPYADYQTQLYSKTMDLSNISEFEDLMATSSDEISLHLRTVYTEKHSGLN